MSGSAPESGKMADPAPQCGPAIRLVHEEEMTITPKEIDPAALKNSASEKISPMTMQYLRIKGE